MERPPMERALSTDVVMDVVLRHLKVRDLLTCRKVSKFWNKAASSVLRRRSTMIKYISDETDVMELQECIEQNSDFPFAGLNVYETWKWSFAGAMEFLKIYGARFARVRLMISTLTTRLQDIAPFINPLPRLSTLELGWRHAPLPRVESLDGDAGPEDGKILKLSSVRTIRILSSYTGGNEDIFREINEDFLREMFAAASPSLRIECPDATYEMLKLLKRVGKLQAVSVMNLYPEDENWEDCALNSVSSEWPALTKLHFDIHGCVSREGLIKLLVSSQHTLKELHLAGVCPSELTSECPVLAKLTKLSVCITDEYEYVFQGSLGYKFPALKELKIERMLDFSIDNLTDGLFIVPSLTTIRLAGHVDKAGIEDLAQCFPNVMEVQLSHDAYDFGRCGDRDPFDIWSVGAFKGLEKLRIRNCTVQWPTKYYNFKVFTNLEKFKTMNMDSFLTGIPITICENLRKHNQQNLMDSPFNEILRDSPSILQLKNLKELTVHVNLEQGLTELPEEPPFISMVSVWYALQMMPNLQAKFVYDYLYPVWREDERDKQVKVVKTAFKHVRPYVELEPFFY